MGSSVLTGFQAATNAGPMCEEPMMGVCFVIEDFAVSAADTRAAAAAYGPITGQVITAMKEGCRAAFQAGAPRLMQAMLECNLEVPCKLSWLPPGARN